MPNVDLEETAYYRAHFAVAQVVGAHVEDQKRDRILDCLRLQPSERVLDVGCGLGTLAATMSEHGAEVVGADVSPVCIESARRRYPAVRYEVVDGMELDRVFTEASFDAVTCVQVLEHIPPDDVGSFIAQLAKVLRDGGRLLVDVPVTDNLSDRWLMVRNQHLRGLPRPPDAIDSSFNPTHRWRIGAPDTLMERFGMHHLEAEHVRRVYYVPWLLERLGWERLVERLPARWLEQSLKGGTILFRKGTATEMSEVVEFSAFWTDPPGTRGVARLKKLFA